MIRLNTWMPPQLGIIPHIRIGQRWINILWSIPLIIVLLIPAIAIAQQLRTMPGDTGIHRCVTLAIHLHGRLIQASHCGCGCSIFSICSS